MVVAKEAEEDMEVVVAKAVVAMEEVVEKEAVAKEVVAMEEAEKVVVEVEATMVKHNWLCTFLSNAGHLLLSWS